MFAGQTEYIAASLLACSLAFLSHRTPAPAPNSACAVAPPHHGHLRRQPASAAAAKAQARLCRCQGIAIFFCLLARKEVSAF